MKTRVRKTALAKKFSDGPHGDGITAEIRARLTGRSRLFAKVLVFKSNRAMRKFYREALGQPSSVCRRTMACVTDLGVHVIKSDGAEYIEVDPYYFCIMSFIAGKITTEIVIHECIHAGFAYARRHHRGAWDDRVDASDEEDICYPSGILASTLLEHMQKEGLM